MKKYTLFTFEKGRASGLPGKFFIILLLVLAGFTKMAGAQVTLTATGGLPTGSYTNLKEAFAAINSGSHKGDIIININANIDEGNSPSTLNSSNADPAGYRSILIQPTGNNIVVDGNPGAGFGVIQLNGADNITINGDNPNVAGQNRNLTINNNGAVTDVGGSCIRIATSANVTTADNISILNCILNGNITGGNNSGITGASSAASVSFGIYVGGNGGATKISPPTAITTALESAPSGSSVSPLSIQNNAVNQCGRGIFFNGAASTVSNNLIITQNQVGTPGALGVYPYTTPATTVYRNAIWVAGSNGVSITGNSINNILSYLSSNLSAIELNANVTGTATITGNTVSAVCSNTGNNAALGIWLNAFNGQYTINSNDISSVINSGAIAGFPASAILVNAAASTGNIAYNTLATIYNRGGGPAQGINLLSTGNGVSIYNNFIAGVLNNGSAGFNNTVNANGILLNNGNDHRVYYNSVNLYGVSGATASNSINCLSISSNSQSGIDIRNNIFSNKVTGGAASNVHSCLFMPFAPTASMNLTLNNNAYYGGSTASLHALGFGGAAAYSASNIYTIGNFNPITTAGSNNWRNFSSGLGDDANDFASFGTLAAPPFVSNTDLHIPAATSTALESGGTVVSILNDIDIAPRSSSFPDIGADEFAGTIFDNTPPLISYTPLRNNCTVGNRQLNALITDPSGVPTSGAGRPVLYWKINAGAYTPATGVSLGNGIFQFTFGTGALLGDVVYYYIVAQDGDAIPNITSTPATGATGYTANPPAAATPTTTPDSYTITGTLNAGTYTVGAGGGNDFTTLTAAINAYNNSCLNGAVTFSLVDAGYTTPAETFPLLISNPDASSVNTLTIVPKTGVAVTVSGNNSLALVKLNGADYITFDGLNAGGSSLTFSNTNAAGSVIWIATGGQAKSATNNVIRNCTIKGGGTTGTGYGVISGDGTSILTAASAPNSNNTIAGCTFKSLQDAVYINGNALLQDAGWKIDNNIIGSATATDKMGNRGITIRGASNFSVSGNTIAGITRNSAVDGNHVVGIGIYGNSSTGTISRNKISDITQTGTLAGSYGIILQSSLNASAITTVNNFIWDIKAVGSTNISNTTSGMFIGGGGGYNIYFNSISLVGASISTTANITSALRISPAVTTAGSLNIRNNIFSDLASFGNRYSLYNGSNAAIFGTINNNVYYFTGAQGAVGFQAGNITTLPAWQAATGGDSRSMLINPLFVSNTDLHLLPSSPLNDQGASIATVLTDIDGDSRAATPDIGADEFPGTPCSGTPAGGTIAVSVSTLCMSGSGFLTATGFASGDGISYQWQSSTDNFATITTNLAGQTVPANAATGTINATTYFRLKVTCANGGGTGYSNVVTVTVNNPTVLTANSASRCGTGTLTLTATASAGASLNWFAAATGGASLAFGPTFNTPVISATTTYYVQSSISTNPGSVGPASPTAQGGAIGIQSVDWPVYFDVTQATTLQSVDIFPNTSGIAGNSLIVRNALGVALATIPYTTTVAGGATAQTIVINVALNPGTGYYIEGAGSVPLLSRNESGAAYPYTTPVMKITGNGFDNSYYMCYYNFRYSSTCNSARTAVTATINTAPAINAVANPAIICAGSSTALTATSGNAGYTYNWQPVNLNGATVNVTPATTTTYTVTASDVTGGPNNGCSLKASVTVTVRTSPTAVSVTPASATVCLNTPATQLNATGGILSNISALNENFNGSSNSWTVINNSTGGTFPANPAWTLRSNGYVYNTFTFNSNDASQFYLSNSYAQGSGSVTNTYLQSPAFSLTGFTTANLSFWHHFRYNGGESAAVEVSTDGFTWLPVAGGTYTSTQGASNGFVNANLNLDSYAGQPVVYIRFSNQATWDWWWAIDNVNITGNVTTSLTWTQAPVSPNSMFTDASASIPYTSGTSVNSIYVQPQVSTIYTATATSPLTGNCKTTGTSNITVTPKVSVTISASANPACPSANITFAATVINGGPSPTYQWQVNGANVGTNSPTYVNNTLNTGDSVQLILIGNGGCTFGNPAYSNVIHMTVAPPSGVDVTITASPSNEACAGTPITFTATPLNGGLTPSYQWKVNNVNAGTNSATFVISTLANGDQVTCVMTSNSPCISGPPTATSNQILVTINQYGSTAVVIGTTLGSNTVCVGTQVTVRATPTNQGHGPIYEFFLNNVSQGPQSSNDFIFTPVNGDKVRVKLTSNYACLVGVDTARSNTITMTVLDAAPASVTLSATATLCTGTPITFTATPSNGGVGPNYQFLLNGSPVQSGTSNVYTLPSPSNGNTVQVEMTSTFACATGNPASSAIYTVALNASPTVTTSADCSTILAARGNRPRLRPWQQRAAAP